MVAKTHISFALCVVSVPIFITTKIANITFFDSKELILLLGGVAIGSLLPDIDEPQSKIGRQTLFISHLIHKIFGHRGATHTLLFPLVIGVILYPLFLALHFDMLPLLGIVIGSYLHIAGDMLTKSGCPIYLPLHSRNIGLLPKPLRFVTGSITDKMIGVICLAIFLLCSADFAGFDISWIQHINLNKFMQIVGG
ncbi:hypothetical protein CCZ01_05665 [Helicobacter monodelphidis]|uniref:metal-dependent hydrolase n=1 Tax=Helicobacter sp. 15-1451 TaxID=2004995 RepID=UPI000DCB5EF3|nr:metal-dependent hydrolase [Helicobacter sp. 15-1451]RAX57626.1 hypothetical protein CCZ01_05665 [Helicobacter sp. 15-1451]